MASITHGMNVAQVQSLGNQLKVKACDINNLVGQLNALVQSSNDCWVGPDSNQFRANWGAIQATLRNAANQLDAYGVKALANVNAQTATSAQL